MGVLYLISSCKYAEKVDISNHKKPQKKPNVDIVKSL